MSGGLEIQVPGTIPLTLRGGPASSSNLILQSNTNLGTAYWITAKANGTLQIGGNGSTEPGTGAISITSAGVVTIGGNLVWHAGNDGAGSGLDSDLLDGQQGTFYTNRANHTGTQDISSTTTGTLGLTRGGTGNSSFTSGGIVYAAPGALTTSAVGTAGFLLQSGGAGAPTWISPTALTVASASTATTAGSANVLSTARFINGFSFNGSADVTFNYEFAGGAASPGPLTFPAASITLFNANNSTDFPGMYWTGLTVRPAATQAAQLAFNWNQEENAPGDLRFRVNDDTSNTSAWGPWRRIMVEGFDLGSWNININGNAATVANFSPSTSAVGNTLVARDGNGYAYAVYLNQSSPNNEMVAAGISQIMVTNGSDNFLRKASIAQVAAAVGTAYVLKSGDSMSGALSTPTLNATTVGVGGGGLTSSGTISASGNITSTGGSIIAAGQVIAGSGGTGTIRLVPGGSGNSGYLEFWPPTAMGSQRQGYIGFSPTASSADTGTIPYIAGLHAFTGSMSVTGNISANGNVTAYASDGRLKKNVEPISNAVEKVRSLGGFKYDWDLEKCAAVGFKPERETEHGLIAQEVEVVIPDAVAPAPFNPEYKTIRYDRLVALLMAAVSEQQKQIEALVDQVNELKAK